MRTAVLTLLGIGVAGCGSQERETGVSTRRVADSAEVAPAIETETGEATYYADVLDRKRTASGELMDQTNMVAAHRTFPFGTLLRVTNLENDRSVQVRVIDRGPYGAAKMAERKVIDLSRRAAERLGFLEEGRAVVRVEVLSFGDGLPAGR